MGRSDRVRAADVREMMRLIGEVRELGDDAVAWRTHLLHGMNRLLGMRVGLSGEVPGPRTEQQTPPQVQVGWDDPEQAARAQAIWESEQVRERDPFFNRYYRRGRVNCATLRPDLADDQEWYGQSDVADRMRHVDVDMGVHSIRVAADGRTCDIISVHPRWRGKGTERGRLIVSLLHEQVASQIGRSLASRFEPSPRDLSPRQQEVLKLLMDGLRDKEIARTMRLSPHTINEYVKGILRHFNVSGRSELLALFLRRHRGNPTRGAGAS